MNTSEATHIEDGDDHQRTTSRLRVALNVLAWQSTDTEQPYAEHDIPTVATPVPAFVKNFSVNGMFLVTTAAFQCRSIFWLRLNVGNKISYAKVLIKRSVKMQIAGRPCYGYGVEFINTPQTSEFTETISGCLPAIRNSQLHVNVDCRPGSRLKS